MTFDSFDDCLAHFKRIPGMEFEEFCAFFNDVLRAFPDKKKHLLDLFYDFGAPEVDNESNFVAVADAIVSVCRDINDLPLLLSYFDDSKWAFDSLTTTIGTYPDPSYTESLLDHLCILLPHAIEWASFLLGRVLNGGEEAYRIMEGHLHKCPREPLKNVLEHMLKDEDWEHLFPSIHSLLEELG